MSPRFWPFPAQPTDSYELGVWDALGGNFVTDPPFEVADGPFDRGFRDGCQILNREGYDHPPA